MCIGLAGCNRPEAAIQGEDFRKRYIDVKWLRENMGGPVRFASKVSLQGYEIRKMEFFAGGALG